MCFGVAAARVGDLQEPGALGASLEEGVAHSFVGAGLGRRRVAMGSEMDVLPPGVRETADFECDSR